MTGSSLFLLQDVFFLILQQLSFLYYNKNLVKLFVNSIWVLYHSDNKFKQVTFFVKAIIFKPRKARGWYYTYFDANHLRLKTGTHTSQINEVKIRHFGENITFFVIFSQKCEIFMISHFLENLTKNVRFSPKCPIFTPFLYYLKGVCVCVCLSLHPLGWAHSLWRFLGPQLGLLFSNLN